MLNENVIAELVRRKVVSDTFRKLAPDKKLKLYNAALRLFAEYGYDGLAVDEFCRQCKISKGSFFQYFPSKSHLLEFTLLTFDSYLKEKIEVIKRNESSVLAKDRLAYLFSSLTTSEVLNSSEKRFFLFVANALNHSAVAVEGIDIARHINSFVIEIIMRGIETKEIRADYNSQLTGNTVALTINAVLNNYYLDNSKPDRETIQYLTSFFFDGIKS